MSVREEEQQQQQHSSSLFLCEEQPHTLDLEEVEEHSRPNSIIEEEFESDNNDSTLVKSPSLRLILLDNDMFKEEHQELLSLLSKQRHTLLCSYTNVAPLVEVPLRYDAVMWISKVSVIHGFTALTTVLAVNYFDRFITSLRFQMDKPWITHLTAVACLSLAAKMEETHVPLLLDLQVMESRFLFEAKSIQRMELLVLSTLKWRMNPVTPISFIEHFVRRFGLKSPLHWEFLRRSERVLLSVIADSRVMSFLPSTLAAATMIHVIKDIDPFNAMECRTQLLALLKTAEAFIISGRSANAYLDQLTRAMVSWMRRSVMTAQIIHGLRHHQSQLSQCLRGAKFHYKSCIHCWPSIWKSMKQRYSTPSPLCCVSGTRI
ncbi:PREDICTED: cyclin-D3-1-like isoform X2 [Lupinus angustifolius]|uniref:cyclin-D3-1-like isoform X2 n=1 Tax=Lupinus angustifolius TaxID=3871 RepID=UPI00092F003E|nr:PREDICTED: cyclin-D3-1-like isoform X2 [Lupinus angustifolius]